jgi:D-3-phosphoglycerate dehydrogenase
VVLFGKNGPGFFIGISETCNMRFHILNAEPEKFNTEARDVLKQLGTLHEETCSRDRLLDLIPAFDVLIVRLGHMIDSEIFDRGKKLKIVVTAATGLNHIDLNAALAHGVEVLSLKDEREFLTTITATAELTWCLALSLARRLPVANRHVLVDGLWNRDMFVGNELRNKTLGIIGYGRLGSIVAEYGRVFRMKVLAHDPYKDVFPEHVRGTSLMEVLRHADLVSVHVNLNERTRGLLGQKEFLSMKKGAFFINTSRGELIDEVALLDALESGQIGGAALDVLQGETSGKSEWLVINPLWNYARSHDNLILTPHIGGATVESMADTELFMARKLRDFISMSKSR